VHNGTISSVGLAGEWGDGQRVARALGLLLVVPALGGGLFGIGLLSVGHVVRLGSTETFTRPTQATVPPVRPIAIPARACPYLTTVHAASEGAHAAPARSSGPNLAALELALRVAGPHVPATLGGKLERSADFAQQFDAIMGDPAKNAVPSLDSFTAGMGAVDDANHLVGSACGFETNVRPLIEWP
jgi:hypothetical protein